MVGVRVVVASELPMLVAAFPEDGAAPFNRPPARDEQLHRYLTKRL